MKRSDLIAVLSGIIVFVAVIIIFKPQDKFKFTESNRQVTSSNSYADNKYSDGRVLIKSSASPGAKLLVFDTDETYHYPNDVVKYDSRLSAAAEICGISVSRMADMFEATRRAQEKRKGYSTNIDLINRFLTQEVAGGSESNCLESLAKLALQ